MSQWDGFLAVRPSGHSEKGESGLCSRLCADAWRLLCLSLSSSWSSSSSSSAVYLVRCDSSQFMSLCIGLLARAGGLIALLCNCCIVLRLLLICDVESALSLLAAVVSLLGCACDVRAGLVVSCRVFLTAGRRGGQPHRPCRALSVRGVGIVNDGFVRDCHMGSSLFWSCVAHLVSLHSSYSHRTPREGVRFLSGRGRVVSEQSQTI